MPLKPLWSFFFTRSKEAHSSHSQSQHLLTSEPTHTHLFTYTLYEMTSRKQRCLRSLAQHFSPHQVWYSKQCRTLAKKLDSFHDDDCYTSSRPDDDAPLYFCSLAQEILKIFSIWCMRTKNIIFYGAPVTLAWKIIQSFSSSKFCSREQLANFK